MSTLRFVMGLRGSLALFALLFGAGCATFQDATDESAVSAVPS
jgi:hypothetical protein